MRRPDNLIKEETGAGGAVVENGGKNAVNDSCLMQLPLPPDVRLWHRPRGEHRGYRQLEQHRYKAHLRLAPGALPVMHFMMPSLSMTYGSVAPPSISGG